MTTSLATNVVSRLAAGSEVVTGACCGAPTTLLRALGSDCPPRTPLVHLTSGLLLDSPFAPAVRDGRLAHTTWHVSREIRDLVESGQSSYLPIRASEVPAHLLSRNVDVALIRTPPPDGDGWISFGPSVSYASDIARHARQLVVEVDPALPRVRSAERVHRDRVTQFVDAEDPTPTYRTAPVDETAATIARHLVGLLPEAPTLQLGIGAVPEAFAGALLAEGAHGLRFVGLATDAMVDLAQAGLLAEPDGQGAPVIAVELMGSRRLMEFADDTPLVQMVPSRTLHDPGWLGRHDRLMSINSALEVDLSGQVNSETIDGQQIAGIGGSMDFFEGARRSRGGLCVVALPSATKDGRRSRIVPSLGAGAAVTIPRHSVDVVVTEHGVAWLRGATTRERAERLTAVAAPAFRPALDRA